MDVGKVVPSEVVGSRTEFEGWVRVGTAGTLLIRVQRDITERPDPQTSSSSCDR
jgi:hypothetical protein